jgi:hypothetical protein
MSSAHGLSIARSSSSVAASSPSHLGRSVSAAKTWDVAQIVMTILQNPRLNERYSSSRYARARPPPSSRLPDLTKLRDSPLPAAAFNKIDL